MTDREKVIKGLEESVAFFRDRLTGEMFDKWLCASVDALVLLKAQESVVRCKDCMYWKSNMLTHFWKRCDVVNTDKDWYCPCGKRR